MRLVMIRAGVAAAAAALALAACAGHGIVPSSPSSDAQSASSGLDQGVQADALTLGPDAVPTCAKTPPQYWWIFKGACQKINLTSSGAHFSLAEYDDITVKGSIGKNNAKGSVVVYLADATNTNGDITKWSGKTFPKYVAKGKTFLYAVAVNQSTQIIKPVPEKGKPVLQYIITDSKGLPGSTCGVALLEKSRQGKFLWTGFPGTFKANGKTVTITQYSVPAGFAIPPKTPTYFAVNCF